MFVERAPHRDLADSGSPQCKVQLKGAKGKRVQEISAREQRKSSEKKQLRSISSSLVMWRLVQEKLKVLEWVRLESGGSSVS